MTCSKFEENGEGESKINLIRMEYTNSENHEIHITVTGSASTNEPNYDFARAPREYF